ncbi:MAG: hypothetical protein IKO61_06950 [Lachnospiraceae bacterium]|nr:hypothetical protein [Lachnospiraceae bacterium]
MKVKVGFITAWRRAVFIAVMFGILFVGLGASLGNVFFGKTAIANAIGVLSLFVALIPFALVFADRNDRFTDEGEGRVENGVLFYKDRKRNYEIKLDEIKTMDMKDVKMSERSKSALCYALTIKTEKKTYIIESDRAAGRSERDVDLYRLYSYLLDLRKKEA